MNSTTLVGHLLLGAAGRVAFAKACAYLWPVAAVMMKAPGAAGLLISRAAFEANPQLYYFQLLRHAGVQAAVNAFAA
ncbi:hypothetical protein C2845_PM03G12420 [Panicum miliaceum]|uniref:Uncharacterized protein n=1 Tax=Panicum miliaceum TaxID=4540 RepID=A0A3L6TBK8_PANMI|nr:hypothetical protein C2845_PM03G12420 [Panicum miliaceum]